ncbi:D-tyrosyl-tRNA(Tyr) deacylase [gamma proteobacterium HTCC5015]|nr:D-tyrosyl-tRNA(Tyr) deacylase [gamma proteobacterium HTCC5015]
MIALIQRVQHARVTVDDRTVGEIGPGLLALVGVEKGDNSESCAKLSHKLLHYRVFNDEQGKMNLNLAQVDGELLLVSQFTLAADTRKGLRPSFSSAAPPNEGRLYFDQLLEQLRDAGARVKTGEFGADMQVHLQNDGPVTFWLKA